MTPPPFKLVAARNLKAGDHLWHGSRVMVVREVQTSPLGRRVTLRLEYVQPPTCRGGVIERGFHFKCQADYGLKRITRP